MPAAQAIHLATRNRAERGYDHLAIAARKRKIQIGGHAIRIAHDVAGC